MANTPMEYEKFKQGLIEDVARAESQAKQTGQALGGMPQSDIKPFQGKALRMKGRLMGQAELSMLEDQFNNVKKYFLENAGFVNDMERTQFETELNNRVGQFKTQMLRMSGELQKKLAKEEISRERRNAIIKGLGSIGSSVGTALVMGIGKKLPEQQTGEGGLPTAGALSGALEE